MTNDKHLEVGKIIYEAVGGLHAMGAVKGTGMAFTQEKNGTFQFSHLPSKKENAKPVNHTKISLNDDNLYDIQLSNVENGEQTLQKEISSVSLDNVKKTLEEETGLSFSLKQEPKKTRKKTTRPK